jgi:hypothetical protein
MWFLVILIVLICVVAATWRWTKYWIRQRTESERQAAVEGALADVRRLLTPCLIIDSNIWMTQAYDAFFETMTYVCRESQYTISLLCPQFDEIANLKNSTQFGTEKSRAARLAIGRIEDFQKSGILTIKDISINAKPGSYADPIILRLLSAEASKGTACTFISDDKELRIRVRAHLQGKNAKCEVIEMEHLLPRCRQAVSGLPIKKS